MSERSPTAPLTEESAGREASEPVFARCRRWRAHLTDSNEAYRELELERERGWQSPALDAWYRNQWASQKGNGEGEDKAEEGKAHAEGPADSSLPPSVKATTSFAAANISQLTERYREHCRRVLPPAAPTFFTTVASSSASVSEERPQRSFLDLGCAPGGVSKYLVKDLGWAGIGLTLATSAGGIAVDPGLTTEELQGRRFTLWEGDVTQMPETWRSTVSTSEQWDPSRRFSFVNGGAVQDHGQRLMQQQQQQQQPQAPERHNGGIPDATMNEAILPWLTLFVPQLRTALAYVEEGGTIMLVYGAPHCASLMILLRALETLLADPSTRQEIKVSILPTMHVMKPPVYVLVQHVSTKGKQEGIARLLASLDPSSPVLSPIAPAEPAAVCAAEAPLPNWSSMTAQERLQTKQLFWLGESDEGFRLAQEGLTRYGHLVGGVWEAARRCLLSRRLRAERSLSGDHRTMGHPQRRLHHPNGGAGGVKRSRQ